MQVKVIQTEIQTKDEQKKKIMHVKVRYIDRQTDRQTNRKKYAQLSKAYRQADKQTKNFVATIENKAF